MGTESHYHSKKDRVFVRGIQGQYSLKDELKRLRAMPRVRKGKEIKFVDGPQTYSRHYVEPKDGITQTLHIHLEEYGPGGRVAEARPRQRGGVLHPRRASATRSTTACATTGSAGDVAIVHNNCVHQHFNAEPGQAGARAGDQDQADVHVHEHAVPAPGRAAARPCPRRAAKSFKAREGEHELQPSGGVAMAWDESKAWKKGRATARSSTRRCSTTLRDAPARNAKRKKVVHPEDMPWEMARQGCSSTC